MSPSEALEVFLLCVSVATAISILMGALTVILLKIFKI